LVTFFRLEPVERCRETCKVEPISVSLCPFRKVR
jgi:hypothetical protein